MTDSRGPTAIRRNRRQDLIDAFTDAYNHHRPHRPLPHRATPATAYTTRPKAAPGDTCKTTDPGRIRTDTIEKTGAVTLRHNGNSTTSTPAESTPEPASSTLPPASSSAT